MTTQRNFSRNFRTRDEALVDNTFLTIRAALKDDSELAEQILGTDKRINVAPRAVVSRSQGIKVWDVTQYTSYNELEDRTLEYHAATAIAAISPEGYGNLSVDTKVLLRPAQRPYNLQRRRGESAEDFKVRLDEHKMVRPLYNQDMMKAFSDNKLEECSMVQVIRAVPITIHNQDGVKEDIVVLEVHKGFPTWFGNDNPNTSYLAMEEEEAEVAA